MGTLTTTGGERVVTVAGSSISLDLGSVATDLINMTNGSGAFIITNAGMAGTSTATIATHITGVTFGGTFTVRINTTNVAVNETVQVAEDAMRTVLAPALASTPKVNQIEPAAHESNDVEAARELVARS